MGEGRNGMPGRNFRVLLIHANSSMDTLIPPNLATLSACLKRAGNEVRLFDTTFYNKSKMNFFTESKRSTFFCADKTGINIRTKLELIDSKSCWTFGDEFNR